MKAILKTNAESAYSAFNGHTFQVVEFNNSYVSLQGLGFSSTTLVDFLFTEVLIVDLDMEIRSIESRIADIKAGLVPEAPEPYIDYLHRMRKRLQDYCIANGFEFNVD